MDQQLTTIVTGVIMLLIGILVSFFIREPMERLRKRLSDKREDEWNRRKRIEKETRTRARFRVTQLCDPTIPFDFSSILKEQNRLQDIIQFEIDDFRKYPTQDEVSELKRLNSKKEFLQKTGDILALKKGETWQGLSDSLPDPHYKGLRELIITNIPLPGNFYGWNSKDRTLLIVSIYPVIQFFPNDGKPTIEDFIIRMSQRMTIFSIIPNLNPKQVHIETSTGCLFDFNVLLRGVVDVVKSPDICPSCGVSIVKQGGDEFYENLKEWLMKAPATH